MILFILGQCVQSSEETSFRGNEINRGKESKTGRLSGAFPQPAAPSKEIKLPLF